MGVQMFTILLLLFLKKNSGANRGPSMLDKIRTSKNNKTPIDGKFHTLINTQQTDSNNSVVLNTRKKGNYYLALC